MQSIARRSRSTLLAGVLGLVGFAGAAMGCGGDSGGGTDAAPRPDGSMNGGDSDASETDAGSAANIRTGTISVLDLKVTNMGIDQSGAYVSISYSDSSATTVQPAFGTANPGIGECAVYKYTAGTDAPPMAVDEGDVTISGTVSPVGKCAFEGERGRYTCPTLMGRAGAGSSAIGNGDGTVTLTFLNRPFNISVVGTYIEIDGFTNPVYNGRFTVTRQLGATTIELANPGGSDALAESVVGAEGPTFTIYAAEGPTAAKQDFLDAGSNPVTIEKAEGMLPGFSHALAATGEGFSLSASSTQPHALPDADQDVRFSCSSADGGSCGASGGVLTGLVLSGVTTDASVEALGVTDMPPAQGSYATFLCRSNVGAQEIILPAAAMEIIRSTNPTRIATQISRVTVQLEGETSIVTVGHGLIGYTTY